MRILKSVILLAILAVLNGAACMPPSPECVVSNVYKRDLEDISKIFALEGEYFLGTGGTSTELQYVFAEILPNGARFSRVVQWEDLVYFKDGAEGDAWVEYNFGHIEGNENSSCTPKHLYNSVQHSWWYEVHIPVGSEIPYLKDAVGLPDN